jgi:SAM-dependent methyltransferase
MFDFHQDKLRYFEIQKTVTAESIIPLIEKYTGDCSGKYVLEIGCAEAGVLQAFVDQGSTGVGVELSDQRVISANMFMADSIAEGKAVIINNNIFDIHDPVAEFGRRFDIIVLKDVIEHIPDQAKFIAALHNFLEGDGFVFFAYPPWWMPFGGHQQICANKVLRILPWFHLLPVFLYKALLIGAGESKDTIKELLEIKATGINIETMYKILGQQNFKLQAEILWLVNPIYRFKFGLKSRVVCKFFSALPYLRNFYTTAHYILFCKSR